MSANGTTVYSNLRTSVLCWLLCHADGGTPRKLADVFFKAKGPESEDAKRIKEELNSLVEGGFVLAQKRLSYALTSPGRETALQLLGWKKLEKDADWRVVKRQLDRRRLEEKAPEPPPGPTIDLPEADGDKIARTLAKAYQLMVSSTPKLVQVVEGLAWYALGIRTAEAFTTPAAIEVLLSRLAGSETRLSVRAAVERLVTAGIPATPTWPSAEQRGSQIRTLPESDNEFAARVLSAARASKTGRFGREKVFISHVLRQLAREGEVLGDEEAFKTRLVEVHRRHLLSLSRADLVEAMKPEDVAESETRYMNATFHFVRLG